MTIFFKVIEHNGGNNAPALLKHLRSAKIYNWKDLTKSRLFEFRDNILNTVASTSARTYMAVLKSILMRYEEDEKFCREYRQILHVKNEKAVKTYLTTKELERLEHVKTNNQNERFVQLLFLIGAYTGMRISDAKNVTKENIQGDVLSYVSQKTKINAVVPCSERIKSYINEMQANDSEVSLAGYNDIIRRLCRRAGITERVKVYRAGVSETGEKWRFISSHTARISFCTNLSDLNVPLIDIARMAGHSSVTMTERYIIKHKVSLPSAAMKYFC